MKCVQEELSVATLSGSDHKDASVLLMRNRMYAREVSCHSFAMGFLFQPVYMGTKFFYKADLEKYRSAVVT